MENNTIKITTKSENTIKAYEFLQAHPTEMFTLKQVAEALGLSTAQVLGGLTSLSNKGAVAKEEVVEGEKTLKAYHVVPEVAVEFDKQEAGSNKMTEGSVRILQYLQANGDGVTFKEIADGMGIEPAIAVNGSINSLVKKNLVVREEVEIQMGEETKTAKVIRLTDEGRAYQF